MTVVPRVMTDEDNSRDQKIIFTESNSNLAKKISKCHFLKKDTDSFCRKDMFFFDNIRVCVSYDIMKNYFYRK